MVPRGSTTFGVRQFGKPSFPVSFIHELMEMSMKVAFFDKGEPNAAAVAEFMDCDYMTGVTEGEETTLYFSGNLRDSPIYVLGSITISKRNIFDNFVCYSYYSTGNLTFRTNKAGPKNILNYINFDSLKKLYNENWVNFNRVRTHQGILERVSDAHPNAFKTFKYRHEKPIGKGTETAVSFMCVDLDANGNVENFSFNTMSNKYE